MMCILCGYFSAVLSSWRSHSIIHTYLYYLYKQVEAVNNLQVNELCIVRIMASQIMLMLYDVIFIVVACLSMCDGCKCDCCCMAEFAACLCLLVADIKYIYVTGYWKTDHNVTLGQLHFIGPANSHTHALSMHCCITGLS